MARSSKKRIQSDSKSDRENGNVAQNLRTTAGHLTGESLVDTARKTVPSFKWIIAAAALLSLAGVVIRWGFSLGTLVLVAVVLLIAAIAIIILGWISKLDAKRKTTLAAFATWCFTVALVAVVLLVFASACMDKPWPLRALISNYLAPPRLPAPRLDTKREAREAARKILGRLVTVTLPNNSNHQTAHRNAIDCLALVGDLDMDLNLGTTKSNTKSPRLTAKQVKENREKRAHALDQFRSNAKSVVADWQAIADAVTFTESNVEMIDATPGMRPFATALRKQLPGWVVMRDDLEVAIALATGKVEAAPPDSRWDLPTTGWLGHRLQGGLNGPFDALRLAWEQIAAAASNGSE